MKPSTRVKGLVNSALRSSNLRIETLTSESLESERIEALARRGHFDRMAYPIPEVPPNPEILAALNRHRDRFDDFARAAGSETGYVLENEYFGSPDAEVLYAILRLLRPARIVEIGCGHSSRLIRQAIIDGEFPAHFVGIDVCPRIDIAGIHDEFHARPVEEMDSELLFGGLSAGDILFIDSSHEIRSGNDVLHLHLNVLPRLPAGVVVHVHDVFLPFEYPREWIENGWEFAEQYLLHAVLQPGGPFEIIWPGHFYQRTADWFDTSFPHRDGRWAQSFWMRKRAEPSLA